MKRTAFATVLIPVAGFMLLGAAFAQAVTMKGETVPPDQIPAVQDWCKELQAQQGLTGTQQPESTMTEEQAERAAGSEGPSDVEGIDLSTITLEMCQEAGFTNREGD